jgi:hypothetical protein
MNLAIGLTRIWIVVLVVCELLLLAVGLPTIVASFNENPFDQYDHGYQSVSWRMTALAGQMIAIAIFFAAIWLVTRWVARGFQSKQ